MEEKAKSNGTNYAYACVSETFIQHGMTIREQFAMAAMQAYLGSDSLPIKSNSSMKQTQEFIAFASVQMADLLLLELQK